MSKEPVTIHYENRLRLRTVQGPIIYVGKHNADVNEGHPLLIAAENIHDNSEAVEALIDIGAAVNLKDEYGRVPLHFAARQGNLYIAEVLIKRGAKAYLKDNYEINALHLAAHESTLTSTLKKRISLIKLLLDKGINVNSGTENKATALMAALGRHTVFDVVKVLLEAGADARRRDEIGRTCLFKSMMLLCDGDWEFERIDVIIELIRAGASVYDKFMSGPNSIDIIFRSRLPFSQKCKLMLEVVKMVTLKKYPGQMHFENASMLERTCQRLYVIALQMTRNCYIEVEEMNSIRLEEMKVLNYFLLRRPTKLNDFALSGSKDWKVLDAALDVIMKYTFDYYYDSIASQFTRLYLRNKIFESGIYTSTDHGNISYEKSLIRAFCEYLSKVDMVNLLKVLIKSPPGV